jgi:hypothetical protein
MATKASLKEINLGFHCSERVRSNLMVAQKALEELLRLEGEERRGGQKVAVAVLEAVRGEINLARSYCDRQPLDAVEGRLMEAIGDSLLGGRRQALLDLAAAVSVIATLSNNYIQLLSEEGWL